MNNNELIFLNQSVSQINNNDNIFIDQSYLLSKNISNNKKSKFINIYFITQNNSIYLLKIKKYLDKNSQIFVINILY